MRMRALYGKDGFVFLGGHSANYAIAMRKYQIETFRREVPNGGYVVSVLRDFPLAGMGLLDKNLDELEQRLAAARERGACLLCMGWGGGLSAKISWLDTTNSDYRQILEQFQIYNRALATNLPFPKTRRVVFLNNRPATLPGWVELAIEE